MVFSGLQLLPSVLGIRCACMNWQRLTRDAWYRGYGTAMQHLDISLGGRRKLDPQAGNEDPATWRAMR